VILAHYNEQKWAAQYGVDANLVRFSVGLEDTKELQEKFSRALDSPIGGHWNWVVDCWVCQGKILDCGHDNTVFYYPK